MRPGGAVPTGKGWIVVVDDEPQVRDSVTRLLELEGYSVVQAADAAEALRIFERSGPSVGLLVTDLSLPDLNGWELCRRVRGLHPQMRILVLSGSFDPSQMPAELGDVGFLSKPFDADVLARRVSSLLGPQA